MRRDHLRVCGADEAAITGGLTDAGSPPRVRSRRSWQWRLSCCAGITSACAEQTRFVIYRASHREDHLRVCGADLAPALLSLAKAGSPPRVRSRPGTQRAEAPVHGITSACAEQTRWWPSAADSPRDHLRVCGADSCILLCSEPAEWRGIFDLRTAQGELMP